MVIDIPLNMEVTSNLYCFLFRLKESYQSCNGKSRAASPSEKRQRQPVEDVAALLKRIR